MIEFITQVPCWVIVAILVALAWVLAFRCKGFLLSSTNKWLHAVGGSVKHKLFIAIMAIGMWFSFATSLVSKNVFLYSILLAAVCLTICIALVVKGVLMKDERAKMDTYNFWIQTVILLSVGALVLGTVCIFNLKGDNFLLFGIVGTMLSWIFQDVIKGVASYYHLYCNGLIHLGDWIEVPSKGVDGFIKDISLINVKIRNWDDTIASIPTATLQAEHMINLQNMLDGKTYGRRMLRTFTIDTSSVHPMTEEEVAALCNSNDALMSDHVWLTDITYPVLNVTLYRLYLLHWLMNHDKVSRHPRLMAMLMPPTVEGLPLQVYAFLTEYSRQPFELLQSQIMEHVVMSMKWFGLRLYQRPTGYDLRPAAKESRVTANDIPLTANDLKEKGGLA